MPDRHTISACIITRDEASNLPDCLASIAFCDEVVVVDSGSSDATVELARASGARVVQQPWLGFAAQRNVALDHTVGEWVLEIDADERVTPELAAEIHAFLQDPPAGIRLGGLPCREIFLGRALGRSAKYPMYRHRLLLRGAYRHDEGRTVHEGLVPDGPVHPFEGDLEHLLAGTWAEALGDAWRYARLEAGQINAPRTPYALLKGALLRPCVKLLYRLTIDGGWRDGWQGLVKISLECVIDTIVWIRHLIGAKGDRSGSSGVLTGQHYGAHRFPRGSVHVIAAAVGATASTQAATWCKAVQARSADVVLISDSPVELDSDQIRVHRIPPRRPLALIGALRAEEQLRTIDAVMPFGLSAKVVMRLMPSYLGAAAGRRSERDPETIIRRSLATREAQAT